MQQYRCLKCKEWISETDTSAKSEEVISYDQSGRFIGATRVKNLRGLREERKVCRSGYCREKVGQERSGEVVLMVKAFYYQYCETEGVSAYVSPDCKV